MFLHILVVTENPLKGLKLMLLFKHTKIDNQIYRLLNHYYFNIKCQSVVKLLEITSNIITHVLLCIA